MTLRAPPGGDRRHRRRVVTGTGLAGIMVLVLAGWIAAPHAGLGLAAVLRASAALWLVSQHVGFAFRGAGRIGLLPLGLVVLPGALLWRAGSWVVRAGQVRRLRHVGYAAVALAVPYALLAAALALASRSALESSSLPQAVAWGLLLAFAAGGLGGARALAPWPQLVRLLPERPRSMVVGVAGALATLAGCGALIAGISLTVHLHEAAVLERDLAPGAIGTVLLVAVAAGLPAERGHLGHRLLAWPRLRVRLRHRRRADWLGAGAVAGLPDACRPAAGPARGGSWLDRADRACRAVPRRGSRRPPAGPGRARG